MGGGILGGLLLGHKPVCAVEIDEYCRSVLRTRVAEGTLPDIHLHGDIRTFDGRPWRGLVDVVAGGWPCQDLTLAWKGKGLDGERSGLFFELVRVVREIQPQWVFLENVPALVNRGLDRVLWQMADLGYDAAWTLLSANACGANHYRQRCWILAHANRAGLGKQWRPGTAHTQHIAAERSRDVSNGHSASTPERQRCTKQILPLGWREVTFGAECNSDSEQCPCGVDYATECTQPGPTEDEYEYAERNQTLFGRRRIDWWQAEPCVRLLDDGFPGRVAQLRALGNAQVPVVAATAWRTLERMLGV